MVASTIGGAAATAARALTAQSAHGTAPSDLRVPADSAPAHHHQADNAATRENNMEDLILSILRSTPGEGWTALELETTSSLCVTDVQSALEWLLHHGFVVTYDQLEARYYAKP